MIKIDRYKCIKCGLCVRDCPQKCFSMGEDSAAFVQEGCMMCEHCVCVCPKGAITAEGNDIADYMVYDPATCDIDADRMQNFMETRRSIRHFKDREVTEEDIKALLLAAQYAPTAVNSHDVRFTVVRDELDTFTDKVYIGYEKFIDGMHLKDEARLARWRKRIVDRNLDPKDDRLIFGAKAAIVISSARASDAMIAATYIELKAHAMGLGVLFSGYSIRAIQAYDKACEEGESFSEWLGLGDYTPYAVLLIGYPDVTYYRAPKRDEIDVIHK